MPPTHRDRLLAIDKRRAVERRGLELNARGAASEVRVLAVAASVPGVVSVREKTPAEDAGGIDVVLLLDDGVQMPLQVKTTLANTRKHRERYPTIPLVVAGHDVVSTGELVGAITRAITWWRSRTLTR